VRADDGSVAATTVVVVGGERYAIEGSPEEIETTIVGASRGSIMQLAWLTEAGTGRAIALNPVHIVALETASPADPPAPGS
jgi:hypothetical protein